MLYIFRCRKKLENILKHSRLSQDDLYIALINEIESNTDQVPSHVDDEMKNPTTGLAAVDFGAHIWCRPIEDNSLGYFLNVGHEKDSFVTNFSSEGITANQYKYLNNDWHIEPFMAINDEDVVTKKYLLEVIAELQSKIDILEGMIHDRDRH